MNKDFTLNPPQNPRDALDWLKELVARIECGEFDVQFVSVSMEISEWARQREIKCDLRLYPTYDTTAGRAALKKKQQKQKNPEPPPFEARELIFD